MKAIQISEFGGPEKMHYVDLPDLVAGNDQVLLKVLAAGINYADTHQIENSYLSPQKLPLIPGIEVVALNPDGKRVLAPVGSGGYAQLALANPHSLFPIPDEISDGEALAMMVQGTTAFHTLKTMGHLKKGETVLIHAPVGGVGVIAIQLAKLWGATVIASTSSPEKKKLALELGADIVIDSQSEDLKAEILKATNGRGVDLVLEMVGGTTFGASLDALAPFGRMITYGNASRSATREVTGGELMRGSKTVSGFWLSDCFAHPAMLRDVIIELFGLIKSKKIKVLVGKSYTLADAARAHKDLRSRETFGKLVLIP
jgi:NADPH:quinone reductase